MWGKAVKITSIQGFDIKIDASWLLIASLIVWSLATGYFPAELPDADSYTLFSAALVAMLGLFGSLILHELSHAIVARQFGLRVTGITLFLFGGVAELQTEPNSGKSEFYIAIAGPIASLCVALAFWFSAKIAVFAGAPAPVQTVLSYLALINLILALFNLLPAFPMDGGRVLRAWLWARSGDLLQSTRRAGAVSAIAAYAMMMLGVYAIFRGAVASGVWPILIGLFVLATSRAALAQLETRTALDGRFVADLMTRDPWTAQPNQSLADVVNRIFLKHTISFVPVVEEGALLGYVDLQIIRKIDREHWTTTTVDDVLESVSPQNTVTSSTSGMDLISRMMETGRRKYMVVDGRDLVGVVTLSDIMGYLNVFREAKQIQ